MIMITEQLAMIISNRTVNVFVADTNKSLAFGCC